MNTAYALYDEMVIDTESKTPREGFATSQIEASWLEEIDRRWNEYQQSQIPLLTQEQVMAKLGR